MKGFSRVKRCAAVCLVMLAAAVPAVPETFYLARTARVDGTLHLNDLLVRSAESEVLGQAVVPFADTQKVVYLPQETLADILPENVQKGIVGAGVWLLPPAIDDALREGAFFGFLARLRNTVDDQPAGFTLQADELMQALDGISSAEQLDIRRQGQALRIIPVEGFPSTVHISPLATSAFPEEQKPRVAAGTVILVHILRGGLLIEAEARTNRSASVGEQVPVTLKISRKRLDVVLTGRTEAEVRL